MSKEKLSFELTVLAFDSPEFMALYEELRPDIEAALARQPVELKTEEDIKAWAKALVESARGGCDADT